MLIVGAENIAAFSGAILAKPFGINSPKIIMKKIASTVEIKISLLINIFEKIKITNDAAVTLTILLKIIIVDIRLS